MMAAPANGAFMICDPGPCDPGPLLVVVRDFGVVPLLLMGAASLMAGLRLSRTNFALPSLCILVVAIPFYLNFSHKMRLVRYSFSSGGFTAENRRLIETARSEVITDYAIGFLIFVVIPLGAGIALNVLHQRKLKRTHA